MHQQQNTGPNIEQMVSARKTEFLFSQAFPLIAGNVMASILIIATYWHMLSHEVLLTWISANLFLLALRVRLSKKFQARNRYDDSQNWLTAYSLSVTVNGCLWGALFVYAGLQLNAESLFFLVLILGALLSGICITYNSYLNNYLYFALPAIIPAAVVLITAGENKAYVGLVSICWFAYLMTIAKRFNKHLSKTIRYEFDNIELLREIKKVNEQNVMLEEELAIKNQILDHLASKSKPEAPKEAKPTAQLRRAI